MDALAARAALSRSHQVTSRLELWENDQFKREVPMLGGQVGVDGGAAIERKFNCEIAARLGMELLTPGVSELRPFRGLIYRGEPYEWALGRFRVSADDITQTPDSLSYKVDCFDISRTLTVNRLYEPLSVVAGVTVENVLRRLFGQVLSGITYNFPDQSIGTCPAMLFEEGEAPWTRGQKLVAQFGFILTVDILGRVQIKAPTQLDVAGVQELTGRHLFSVSNHRDDDPGYNGVKVVSEPQDAPATVAYVWDDDPNSFTYWKRGYGRRVRFYKTQFAMTQFQAAAVAQRQFPLTVGLTTQANFTTFVDPALSAGDVVAVKASGVSIDDRYQAESFTIPLDGGAADMDVTTTKRRNGRTATDLPEAM